MFRLLDERPYRFISGVLLIAVALVGIYVAVAAGEKTSSAWPGIVLLGAIASSGAGVWLLVKGHQSLGPARKKYPTAPPVGKLSEGSVSKFPPPPQPTYQPTSPERPAIQTPTFLGGRPLVGSADQRSQIVCQFCQERGYVTARRVARVKRKTATRMLGAAVTLGGSALLTGVSKKGTVTELSCSNCGMSWDV